MKEKTSDYKGKWPCVVCGKPPFVTVEGKCYCYDHFKELVEKRKKENENES